MRKALAFLLFFLIPVSATAGIEAGDLPADSTWYLHIDFEQMRDSDAGNGIYEWLDDEVNAEIVDEIGINFFGETDSLTAYSAGGSGFVMVMEGRYSRDTRDKLLALAATAEEFDMIESRDGDYYYIAGEFDGHGSDIEIDGMDDPGYMSFAIDNKILMTGTEEQMQELLDNRGRISGQGSHEDALFVLTAERTFVQAGVDAEEMEVDGDGFDSNIAQNTREVAVMIAEMAGKIAVEAQIVTTEAEVANSMASIVRGLIALQIFSEDMDPDVAEVLRNTRVDVDGSNLKISVALSPEVITAALDEA